ncbi:ADP-ribosylglycohydrolase family protein, partial [Escherichia coli]
MGGNRVTNQTFHFSQTRLQIIGNDTDSIATMAGAIAGAWRGFDALP